jgi:ribonuclease BN (tRNA processing enzyme)
MPARRSGSRHGLIRTVQGTAVKRVIIRSLTQPQYRASSAIWVSAAPSPCTVGMLLDCGEGAWTGLVTVAGAATAAAMLRDLAAIWISHQHADHCLGLVDLLGNKACVGVLKH